MQRINPSVCLSVYVSLRPIAYQLPVPCTVLYAARDVYTQTKGAEQRDDLLVDAPQRCHRRPRQTTKQYAEEDCSREGRLGLRLG